MDGMDEQTDRQKDGWMGRCKDGWMDGRMNGVWVGLVDG